MEETVHASGELYLLGSYSTGEKLIEDSEALKFSNVVVMDINLPGKSGIQCIEELKPVNPNIQFLVCTVFEDSMNLFNALCAGATGYILKSADEMEFVKAIKEIHVGGSPMSPQIARMVVSMFPQKKSNSEIINNLTKRERDILDLLAAGLMYKEIAGRLFLSVETVRSYIRDIYSKLHVHSRMEAIKRLQK